MKQLKTLQITKNAILNFIQENNLEYKFYRSSVQIHSFLKTWTNPDTTYRCGIIIEDDDKSKIGVFNDWVAGESGNFVKLIKEFYNCNYYEAKNIIKKLDNSITEITVPTIYKGFKTVFPKGNSILLYKKYLLHLLQRGISIKNILKNNIYVSKDNENFLSRYNNKIIFPFFEKGKQVYYISYDKDAQIKYEKAPGKSSEWVYNIDNCNKDKLIITEGVFDAFICSGVALGTHKISDVQTKKIVSLNPNSIVIAMDILNSDKTFNKNYKKVTSNIVKKLKNAGYKKDIFMLNQKKCKFKDFGELKKQEVESVLKQNTIIFNEINLLKTTA